MRRPVPRENYPNISVSATNAADQPCIKVEPAVPAPGTGTTATVLRRSRRWLAAGRRAPPWPGHGHIQHRPDRASQCPGAARRRSGALPQRARAAGVRPIALQPDDPLVHVFRVPHAGRRTGLCLVQHGRGRAKTLTLGDPSHPSPCLWHPSVRGCSGSMVAARCARSRPTAPAASAVILCSRMTPAAWSCRWIGGTFAARGPCS